MKLCTIAAQPEENNIQARLTERSQFTMVKNIKMIAMNSCEHLFSQMKGNLRFLSQMGKKKCGGERPVNLTTKISQPQLNTMEDGAAGALNVLGDLCFIDGTMDHFLYINILKSHLAKSVGNMVLICKQFFTLDNYPKYIALDTRLWLLCNTSHWVQTPLESPVINQIENVWHNLEDVRNHKISSKNDLKKPVEEEWRKITREEKH